MNFRFRIYGTSLEVSYKIIDSLNEVEEAKENLIEHEGDMEYILIKEAETFQVLDEDDEIVYNNCIDEDSFDDVEDVKPTIPEGKFLIMCIKEFEGSLDDVDCIFEYKPENGNTFEDEVWGFKTISITENAFGVSGVSMNNGKDFITFTEFTDGQSDWTDFKIFDSSWNEIEL